MVASESDYLAGLRDFEPDLILADYRVPRMTGETALDHAMAICPQIPFIFISGTLGEDQAVDLMKRGAWDYVLKDRPSRLGPAVSRSLVDAGDDAGWRPTAPWPCDACRSGPSRCRRSSTVSRTG